jgi:hypothetical protein
MDAKRAETLREAVRGVMVVTGRPDPRDTEVDVWVAFIDMLIRAELIAARFGVEINGSMVARDAIDQAVKR